MDNKFYVYEWYNTETGEVFYVGKGCKRRAFEIRHRNEIFQDYYALHPCQVRIIKNNMLEDEAFQLEKETINKYKELNQCIANLAEGGYGGCNFVWTKEMREYKSIHNPMKDEKQRERMSKHNPMHDPENAKRMGQKHKRPIIINGIYYDGIVDAAKELQVKVNNIQTWLKRGFDTNNNPCQYADGFTSMKRGKNVLIDDIEFKTVTEGAKFLEVSVSALSHAIRHSGFCKGHKVEYVNQQPSQ